MSGILNTTYEIALKGALPSGATTEQVIRTLHDHDFIIRCDKNLDKYEEVTDSTKSTPELVEAALKPIDKTKCYIIHDNVKNVPGGIWDSKIDSTVEYTNLETGVFMVSKPPMGIVSRTELKVEDGQLVLNCKISCSKLLLPMVKSGFQENLEHILASIVKKVES